MGGTQFGATMVQPMPSATRRSGDNLALIFQEILTAIIRLRSGRQRVDDANLFRTQIKGAIASAEQDAMSKGYSPDDARLGSFAVVAFLDESILNSTNPVFADWARMPLQEELYGHHMAGEVFFENVQKLIARPDAHNVADVLEMYAIAMLMGYLGRFRIGEPAQARPILQSILDKIRRVRGGLSELAPGWAPPRDTVKVTADDPWVARMLYAAIGCIVLAAILFGLYFFLLSSGASGLRAAALVLGLV